MRRVTDRFHRVFTYQDVDRVPDIEFGYWPQTIRRWLGEGLLLDLSPEETEDMFSHKVDDWFGFENEGHTIPRRTDQHPALKEEILERKAESVILRGGDGIVAERYLDDSERSSIPHFIEFPVKTPQDWEWMKQYYRLDDPIRAYPETEIAQARQARDEGKAISFYFVGFYGQFRHYMGMENLSYAFYEFPDMIHDMVCHWADMCTQQIERLPADIPIDQVGWWEDMAYKNGPHISPKTFREFLQPGYHRVMTAARQRGCTLGDVDCDGNPHDLVANWLQESVNIMYPLEIEAGVDPQDWRDEFGKDLRLRGGIAKRPLVEGGKAIDRELERIRPLFEEGGYIPHLDHCVPPNIPYAHYCEYLEKKRRLIGK